MASLLAPYFWQWQQDLCPALLCPPNEMWHSSHGAHGQVSRGAHGATSLLCELWSGNPCPRTYLPPIWMVQAKHAHKRSCIASTQNKPLPFCLDCSLSTRRTKWTYLSSYSNCRPRPSLVSLPIDHSGCIPHSCPSESGAPTCEYISLLLCFQTSSLFWGGPWRVRLSMPVELEVTRLNSEDRWPALVTLNKHNLADGLRTHERPRVMLHMFPRSFKK